MLNLLNLLQAYFSDSRQAAPKAAYLIVPAKESQDSEIGPILFLASILP